ncbi:hypothetical protein EYF80_002531 [Liparis tanakae]|uniref:Uncharacterized protein n=1 Tax=Liparis tanakae TaxID=230148 RepID=A0A4Z2JB44_9TELE|nr:hypothetical protein EYF80_002531 [Liparis tanakae]
MITYRTMSRDFFSPAHMTDTTCDSDFLNLQQLQHLVTLEVLDSFYIPDPDLRPAGTDQSQSTSQHQLTQGATLLPLRLTNHLGNGPGGGVSCHWAVDEQSEEFTQHVNSLQKMSMPTNKMSL